MSTRIRQVGAWVGGVCALLALLAGVGRAYASRESARIIFSNDHDARFTPKDYGAPYEELQIPVGTRTLDAVLVRAPASRTAVFLCHGQGETVAYWALAQKVLRDHGVSSLVFDYSAYGRSTGEPVVSHLAEDASAAYRTFDGAFEPDVRRFVAAHSLGVGVCLAAYPSFRADIAGVVLMGAWSSMRELAVAHDQIPKPLSFLVPDTFDNVTAVLAVHAPLLIVQGGADEVVPLAEPQRILANARGPSKRMLVAEGFDHNAPWERAQDGYWTPILEFFR